MLHVRSSGSSERLPGGSFSHTLSLIFVRKAPFFNGNDWAGVHILSRARSHTHTHTVCHAEQRSVLWLFFFFLESAAVINKHKLRHVADSTWTRLHRLEVLHGDALETTGGVCTCHVIYSIKQDPAVDMNGVSIAPKVAPQITTQMNHTLRVTCVVDHRPAASRHQSRPGVLLLDRYCTSRVDTVGNRLQKFPQTSSSREEARPALMRCLRDLQAPMAPPCGQREDGFD